MPHEIPAAVVSGRKRIAVLLDGTWNTVNDNTNVWRLKSLLAPRGRDGLEQISYYSTGLGTTYGRRFIGGAERLYLVVETKGSLFADALRSTEAAKIICGAEHFKALAVGENPAQFIRATKVDDLMKRV